MKRSVIALAILPALSLWGATPAEAFGIATDFFDDPGYSIGGNVYPDSNQDIGYGSGIGPNTGTGFTTGWQNPYYTSPRTVTAPLSYAGLATSGFGAASPAYVACTYCVNSTAVRYLSNNTATTDLWVSFLIMDVDATHFETYPNYGGFAIEDSSGKFVYVGVPGLQPTSTANYSLQTNTDASQSPVAAAPGQTTLLVADITDTGDAYLYVDPVIGAPLGAPDATIAAPFLPSDVTGFSWSDSWGWTYGDLRVGTTLADVTPAASAAPEAPSWTVFLTGLGVLGASLRWRRNQRSF